MAGDSLECTREELEEGVASVSGVGLMWEFCKLNFQSPGMAWRTLLTLACDQFTNIYLLFTLWSSIYLVDTLLKTDDATTESRRVFPKLSREREATVLGMLYIVPLVFLQAWEVVRIKIDIKYRTRNFLQTCLFRKYLNYCEESRTEVTPSAMQVALM